MEKLYRIKEAAEILGVHPKTLQRWAREGKIRVVLRDEFKLFRRIIW